MPVTRDAVVEVAAHLLREQGLEGVTFRKIAAELGVSAPTLYWHVASKRELLDLLAEHLVRARSELMSDEPGTGPDGLGVAGRAGHRDVRCAGRDPGRPPGPRRQPTERGVTARPGHVAADADRSRSQPGRVDADGAGPRLIHHRLGDRVAGRGHTAARTARGSTSSWARRSPAAGIPMWRRQSRRSSGSRPGRPSSSGCACSSMRCERRRRAVQPIRGDESSPARVRQRVRPSVASGYRPR